MLRRNSAEGLGLSRGTQEVGGGGHLAGSDLIANNTVHPLLRTGGLAPEPSVLPLKGESGMTQVRGGEGQAGRGATCAALSGPGVLILNRGLQGAGGQQT